jgi:DNA-binding transcriptional LysR family regulator
MRAFVAVADAGGFAAAARLLGLSPPAVTRAIAAIEERVGTRLLQRTTRVVRLTEAGTHYLADCKRILAEIDEAEASAAGSHGEPAGQLAVTAPVMFGRLFVAPLVFDFQARHPRVTARLLLVDRVVDLIEEGLHVAVRIANLADSSLSAARVGWLRRVVCASPGFLAAHGVPARPGDLEGQDSIAFGGSATPPGWTFPVAGRAETVGVAHRLAVNTADVAVAAAVAGRGFTRVLSYQSAAEVAAGRLVIVLEDFEPPPIPIHIVHPEGRRASARVRAFVDYAVERLRAEPSLQ